MTLTTLTILVLYFCFVKKNTCTFFIKHKRETPIFHRNYGLYRNHKTENIEGEMWTTSCVTSD